MKKKCKRKGHKWVSNRLLVWCTTEGVELVLYWCERGCDVTRVDR